MEIFSSRCLLAQCFNTNIKVNFSVPLATEHVYSWVLNNNEQSSRAVKVFTYEGTATRTHIEHTHTHTPSVTTLGCPTGWRILILSQAFINLKCSVIDFLSFNCNWIWHTLNWILFASVSAAHLRLLLFGKQKLAEERRGAFGW